MLVGCLTKPANFGNGESAANLSGELVGDFLMARNGFHLSVRGLVQSACDDPSRFRKQPWNRKWRSRSPVFTVRRRCHAELPPAVPAERPVACLPESAQWHRSGFGETRSEE